MFAKTTIFATLALLASVSAQAAVGPEYEGNPNYNFEYSVADPVTGDTKSQSESRQGDVVQGQYSLVEPDGSTRTVNYAADAAGFRAEVSKNGAGAPAQVRKLAYTAPAPLVHHHVVPAVVHHATPYYAAPHVHVAAPYAAPHVHVAAPYAYPHAYAHPAYPGYAGYPYARY